MRIEPLEDTPNTTQHTMQPAQHTLRFSRLLQQHPYLPAAAAQHWTPCQQLVLPAPQQRMLIGTTSSRSSSHPALHCPTQAYQRALPLLAAPSTPASATTTILSWTLSWTSNRLLIQAQIKPKVVSAVASAALSCHQQRLPCIQASAVRHQHPQVPITLTTEGPSCV